MKKLAFSIFAAALTFGANANVEPANAANCCAYDGLFFGLGISAVDAGVKTETTDVNGLGDAMVQTADTPPKYASFPYGDIVKYDHDLGIDTNDHDTRFTGNVTLGYGRRIKEKAYIALEAGLDAGQNSNFCHVGMSPDGGKKYDVFSKNNGLIPSAALRLGYIHPETKTMVYLKAGAAYSQARTTYVDNYLAGYDNGPFSDTEPSTPGGDSTYIGDANPVYDTITYSGKCSKWTPIVAFGFEKVTGKNFRTRAEVEYRFQTTRSFDFNNDGRKVSYVDINDAPQTEDAAAYNGTVKIYNKAAITLRVMGIYTVK